MRPTLHPVEKKAPLLEPEALRDLIVQSLDGDKAEHITVIDLRGKSSLADYMIIASGTSNRHVGALAQHISNKLENKSQPSPALEGLPQNDWVLVDAGDVIVHLFRPEVRAFYNIEEMWGLETPPTDRTWSTLD